MKRRYLGLGISLLGIHFSESRKPKSSPEQNHPVCPTCLSLVVPRSRASSHLNWAQARVTCSLVYIIPPERLLKNQPNQFQPNDTPNDTCTSPRLVYQTSHTDSTARQYGPTSYQLSQHIRTPLSSSSALFSLPSLSLSISPTCTSPQATNAALAAAAVASRSVAKRDNVSSDIPGKSSKKAEPTPREPRDCQHKKKLQHNPGFATRRTDEHTLSHLCNCRQASHLSSTPSHFASVQTCKHQNQINRSNDRTSRKQRVHHNSPKTRM